MDATSSLHLTLVNSLVDTLLPIVWAKLEGCSSWLWSHRCVCALLLLTNLEPPDLSCGPLGTDSFGDLP